MAVVVEVFDDLVPPDEAVQSHSGGDGEAIDTQSFAFDTRGEEEPLIEAPVEQLVEVTRVEAEPVDETPIEVGQDPVELSSPPSE